MSAPTPADGIAIVTGATGGLGYEIVLGLARAGFRVMLTGRHPGRGAEALAAAQAAVPGAALSFELLDVASLASVQAFAESVAQDIAVLVNNAGVMALPQREVTVDGFERQIGTNYLGHFALTARLLPRLRKARVVNVASLAHRTGRIAWTDFQGARDYSGWGAYRQSKLAMLMFGIELQKRSAAHGWGVQGFAAHPGWSATRIVLNGQRPGLLAQVMQAGFNALGQSAAAGALPEIYAAIDPAAVPGGYYGPCCLAETRGRVTPSKVMPQASDTADRARLWTMSEEIVGVRFGG